MGHTVRVNPRVLTMEYAVRGPIPQRAAEMQRAGRRIIPCNIGNPQALGQPAISFYRQMLSLFEDPDAVARARTADRARIEGAISGDVIDLAEEILAKTRTGTGAYTDSAGFRFVRESVAAFIDARDEGGPAANSDAIFLTDGASEGASNVLEALISGPEDGILVPVPQYPLYSAAVARLGGTFVGYEPDEDAGWALSRDTLEAPLAEAREKGVHVRAVVVINPGNPTGAILDEASMRDVIAVARENGLVIIADEVYQENTYGQPWSSFARVLGDEPIPLCSLHSVSKGSAGECGHRGGYLEVRNPPKVEGRRLTLCDVLNKQASVNLCPNTIGQLLVHLTVTGPPAGTPTAAAFERERLQILDDLHAKATMIRHGLEAMPGVSVSGRTGAMYVFPRLEGLPAGTGDFEYCMALLEETGLVTVNGSGFGQRRGTHHLRCAFLPPFDVIQEVMPRWADFHGRYLGA